MHHRLRPIASKDFVECRPVREITDFQRPIADRAAMAAVSRPPQGLEGERDRFVLEAQQLAVGSLELPRPCGRGQVGRARPLPRDVRMAEVDGALSEQHPHTFGLLVGVTALNEAGRTLGIMNENAVG